MDMFLICVACFLAGAYIGYLFVTAYRDDEEIAEISRYLSGIDDPQRFWQGTNAATMEENSRLGLQNFYLLDKIRNARIGVHRALKHIEDGDIAQSLVVLNGVADFYDEAEKKEIAYMRSMGMGSKLIIPLNEKGE